MQNAPADATVKVKHSHGAQNWLVLLMLSGLHNLAANRSWPRDVNGQDRDVCLPRPRHWQYFSRCDQDEMLVCTSQDRDVETETTTLVHGGTKMAVTTPNWMLCSTWKCYRYTHQQQRIWIKNQQKQQQGCRLWKTNYHSIFMVDTSILECTASPSIWKICSE